MDFEKVDLDPDTEEARYERPDFAKVIFLNIAESYPIDAHIQCRYTITSSLVPTTRDWVGLYKVGWGSSREYICFLWSPLPKDQPGNSIGDIDNAVVFQAHNLPGDDGEFYQFCYVSSSGHVRGASTPFQFRRPSADDFVAIEDEDEDIMIIKSKTVALEENLAMAEKEKDKLKKRIDLLETEQETLLSKMLCFEKERKHEAEKRHVAEVDAKKQLEKVNALSAEIENMTQNASTLHEEMSFINQEKDSILQRLDENDKYISDLQEKIKGLVNEKDALIGRNKQLEQEKEMSQTTFLKSEDAMQSELFTLKQDLLDVNTARHQESTKLTQEVEAREEAMKMIHAELVEQKEENAVLGEKLSNAEDKLAAAEKCIDLHQVEVSAAQEAHAQMSETIVSAKSEAHTYMTQLEKCRQVHADEKVKIEEEQQRNERMMELKNKELESLRTEAVNLREILDQRLSQDNMERDGSLYALRTANLHLKEQFSKKKQQLEQNEKEMKELLRKKKSCEERECALTAEIEDMKKRLALGADTYKQLYMECHRLQSQNRKLKKQVRRSSGNVSPVDTRDQATTPSIEDQAGKGVQTDTAQCNEVGTATHNGEDTTETESQTEDIALQRRLDEFRREASENYDREEYYRKMYEEEKEKRAFQKKFYQDQIYAKENELESQKWEINQLRTKLQNVNPLMRQKEAELVKKIEQMSAAPKGTEKTLLEMAKSERHLRAAVAANMGFDNDDDSVLESEDDPLLEASIVVPPHVDPTVPLRPLPAPLQPEVLPTAKAAAVRAAVGAVTTQPRGLDDDPRILQVENDEDRFEDAPDGVEPQFEDADGEPQKLCPVCNTTFPADLPQFQFEEHIDSHYGRICPMCQVSFGKDGPHEEYEHHVNSHFDN